MRRVRVMPSPCIVGLQKRERACVYVAVRSRGRGGGSCELSLLVAVRGVHENHIKSAEIYNHL